MEPSREGRLQETRFPVRGVGRGPSHSALEPLATEIFDGRANRPAARSIGALGASAAFHLAILLGFALSVGTSSIDRRPAYIVLAYALDGASSEGSLGSAGASRPPAPSKPVEALPVARSSAAHLPKSASRTKSDPRTDDRRELVVATVTVPSIGSGTDRRRDSIASDAAHDPGKGAGGAEPSSESVASLAGNGDTAGTGLGGGAGRPNYRDNPPPDYPAEARRENQEGVVVLKVLVAADGSAARVEISSSSGFAALDSSAVETVRRRWRFEPAQRDGVKVESWVLVPIRFTLREASAASLARRRVCVVDQSASLVHRNAVL